MPYHTIEHNIRYLQSTSATNPGEWWVQASMSEIQWSIKMVSQVSSSFVLLRANKSVDE